jgi:DNA-binding CsgD family transcriptional regulator
MRLRAHLRLARGHEGAEPLAQRAIAFLGRPFLHRENRLSLLGLRIQLARHTGDPETALTTVRLAIDEPSMTERPRYGWPLLAAAAAVVAESADEELTARICRLAETMPQRTSADRAHAAQVTATLTGSPELWHEAVTAWRTDGQRYPLAVALLGLATAAAGAGDRTGAAAAVEEVAAVAGALGTRPLSEAADKLARRIGLRSAAQPTPTGTETLTDREREVLRLVAEGRSNSGIAQQLYISPKTASVHVSRIIAKLAVANRGEAAAVAHRLGLLDD